MVVTTPCPGENDVDLVNVNGRIFRRNRVQHKKEFVPSKSTVDEYSDEQCLMDLDYNIEKDPQTSSYKLTFNLPNVFYKFVIGKSGNTKNKIQNETGATIIIPKPNSGSEDIVIRGSSESSVVSAKTRIDLVTESAMKSLPYTHFLSIPLTDPSIQQKLNTLYTNLSKKFPTTSSTSSSSSSSSTSSSSSSSSTSIQGFDPSILVSPSQFHLTILMLKLYTKESLSKAKSLLKESSKQVYDIVGSRSVVVRLQGLEYMNDDPHAVDVLYVKVNSIDGSQRLNDVCKHLVNVFSMANLVPPQDRDVKLHATLMNTRYRKSSNDGNEVDNNNNNNNNQNEEKRLSFDAVPILQNFGEIDLGQIRLSEIQLSSRDQFESDGYWKSLERLLLP